MQPTVAVSTVEAEYYAASAATKEALWLRSLFSGLGIAPPGAVMIKTDNQASLSLLKHPIASQRSKHIDVIYHFSREKVLRGDVNFTYVPTQDMVADIMTKPLTASVFKTLRAKMGMLG